MMLIDRFGRTWQTSLTRRGLRSIEEWTYPVRQSASQSADAQPAGGTQTVPLGIDVTNIVDLLQTGLDTTLKFEVLAAWLFPQWRDLQLTGEDGSLLTGRDAFDEVCDAAFVDAAYARLKELAMAFFGAAGAAALQELSRLEAANAARVQTATAQIYTQISKIAGNSTPDTSTSEQTPTT